MEIPRPREALTPSPRCKARLEDTCGRMAVRASGRSRKARYRAARCERCQIAWVRAVKP